MSSTDYRSRPRSTSFVTTPSGEVKNADEVLEPLIAFRDEARRDRRRYEPAWALAQAFVAGRQWVGFDEETRRIISEPNPRRRERHTVNVLTRHFWTAIGQVYGEDFKPDMLFARPDELAREFVRQARRAFEFAWQEEVAADEAILDLIIETFAFGTAAVRCRFNKLAGEYLMDVPLKDGKPVLDPEEARAHVADSKFWEGDVQMRSMFAGKIQWDVHSPFGMLVPPGLIKERDFPMVGLEQPVPLGDVKAMFGSKADGLEEQDLDAIDMVGLRDSQSDAAATNGKIKGHVLLTTVFERPCPKYPKGRVTTLCQDKLLRVKEELPYKINGEHKAGIAFFHYHRVPRRFWSVGVLEPGIGPQRQRNRARSQLIEMKDKNLGRVYTRKGALTEAQRPVGKIMEVIEVARSAEIPTETPGVPPGPWIQNEVAMNDGDLEKVMGQSDVSLGQAPRGVSAYSAFALLAEQDDRRVGPILKAFRGGVQALAAFTMHDARKYWSPVKHIVIAGPDLQPEAFTFNAQNLPDSVFFRYGTGGPPRPKSPAAQIQLVFDLFDRSVSSGKPLPLDWLYDSLDAGKPLPLPKEMDKMQEEKAELENNLMNQGQHVEVSPSDVHTLHIPIHELAIASLSMIPGAEPVVAIVQQHLAQHKDQAAAATAAAASVPGMQGPQGQLGDPGAAPQPAADAGAAGMSPGPMASHIVNSLTPMPPSVGL